ncbi:MAG: methyl-accepting chemotaxis protein [Zoogloeaceae bacterium]|jgi:methyl-accepting chemotaxis protein|nr:methyl-accepting chemotaxis protein [Zoogloeaceae bacterium]
MYTNTKSSLFQDWPIARKLNVIQALASFLLFALAIFWLTAWLSGRSIEESTRMIKQVNRQTLNMVEVFNDTLEKEAGRLGRMLQASLPQGYALDENEHVSVAGAATPVLTAGGVRLNLNLDFVDRFTATSGAVATVFARTGEDFIRITTSLKKEDGERALGTLLNRDHPARAAILSGQSFTGKARLFNREYMTHYLPIHDTSGRVVGALFIGLDFTTELAVLREEIMKIRFGENGYMYVLDAGKNAGVMVMHPTLEGRSILEEKDADGLAYVRRIIEAKDGVLPYRFVDGNGRTRGKIAVFSHVPKWDWIIVSAPEVVEMTKEARAVRNHLIAGALVLIVLLIAVVFFTSRAWVSRPLAQTIAVLEEIAQGNLTVAIAAHGNDETGRLLAATALMRQQMRDALVNIQDAAGKLAESAQQLVGAADEVATQSTRQSEAATTMAASIEEMHASIEHVSANAQAASQVSSDSDTVSREGAGVIQQAVDSMNRIAGTVRATSGAVGALEQESQSISSIVRVIQEIAEQTNLLALNAAIEAARAGEQGRGFAVVADEVRKLAERTSSSTQEINALIQRILSGTADTVTRMEAGVRQVEEGVTYAAQAGKRIGNIRESASQVSEAITAISQALIQQSSATTSIAQSVEHIADMADRNSQMAQDSARLAAELETLAQTLQQGIRYFRT